MAGKKTVLGTFFISFLVVFSQPGSAADFKIGYVNLEEVFENYNRTKTFNEKLQDRQKDDEAEEQKMIAEINKLKEETELLAEEARKEKEDVIREKLRELYDYKEQKAKAFQKQVIEGTGDILEDILQTIDAVGKEGEYTIIVREKIGEQPILLYKDEGKDLTQEMTERLNSASEESTKE